MKGGGIGPCPHVHRTVARYWKAVVKATPDGKKVKAAAHGVALKNITIGLSQTKIGELVLGYIILTVFILTMPPNTILDR